MMITKKQAYGRMAALCSRKEYCRVQIEEKLRKLLERVGEDSSDDAVSNVERGDMIFGAITNKVAVRNSLADHKFDGGGICNFKCMRSKIAEEGRDEVMRINDISEIIGVLEKENYLSDERFAAAYVNDKLQFGGWGSRKIIYGLKGLGLASEIINNALSERYEGKSNGIVEKMVIAKLRSVKGKPDAKNKVIRYMLGKGFGYHEFCEFLDL